jgi:hypothetical protein
MKKASEDMILLLKRLQLLLQGNKEVMGYVEFRLSRFKLSE